MSDGGRKVRRWRRRLKLMLPHQLFSLPVTLRRSVHQLFFFFILYALFFSLVPFFFPALRIPFSFEPLYFISIFVVVPSFLVLIVLLILHSLFVSVLFTCCSLAFTSTIPSLLSLFPCLISIQLTHTLYVLFFSSTLPIQFSSGPFPQYVS